MKKKDLPMGVGDFEEIRTGNYYYVDKTHHIKELVISPTSGEKKSGKYFLSRPRRFGKSMIVSTIQYLFEGKKELFEGLSIYNNWDFCEKNQHPVIRINFDGGRNKTPNNIDKNIISQLEFIEKYYGIDPEETGLAKPIKASTDFIHEQKRTEHPDEGVNKFTKIIFELYIKTGKKVVILIDEYDKPILDVITDKKQALSNRDYLRDFYGTFKANEKYIHFIFITGISLMSKMNLFSSMNNLDDISMLSECSTICGYTEKELKSVFAYELKNYDFEEIRSLYDGYQWDKELKSDKVFCPHSVLKLFRHKDFDNFWYEDGIPYYVYKILKSKNLNTIELTDRWVDKKFLGRFEVEKIKIDSLLFQSGFLTLKNKKKVGSRTKYLLSYPNEEVKQSLSREFLEHLTGSDLSDIETEGLEILKLLKKLDAEGMQSFINQIFKKVPYYWHGSHKEAKKDTNKRPEKGIDKGSKQDIDNEEAKKMKLSKYECWYASLIYTMFAVNSVDIRVESVNNFGRSDMIVISDNKVFVMEFKLAKFVKDVKRLTDEAIKQVKSRKYGTELIEGERSCLYIVVMVFVQKERNINKVLIEKLKI